MPASSMVRRRFTRRLDRWRRTSARCRLREGSRPRRRPGRRLWAGSGIMASGRSFPRREHHRGRLDAACNQNFHELRPHACGLEFDRRCRRSWHDRCGGSGRSPGWRSHPLHAHDLGNGHHAPAAVVHSLHLDNDVNGRSDLLHGSTAAKFPTPPCRSSARCGTGRRGWLLAWTVVIDPVVAGVHRLQHVEGLAGAHFAHDDPVGAHAQGVAAPDPAGSPRPCPRCSPAGFPAVPTWGCCSCSSAASSMVTTRSLCAM